MYLPCCSSQRAGADVISAFNPKREAPCSEYMHSPWKYNLTPTITPARVINTVLIPKHWANIN